MFNFMIEGETPAKKNSRLTLKNGRTIPGKKFREWHESAMAQIFEQKIRYKASGKVFPVETKSCVSVIFYHADKRRRDSDNALSSVLDALVDGGIFVDDSWQIVERLEVDNRLDKKAFCTICIEKLE